MDAAALAISSVVLLVPGIGASLALHAPGEAPLATRIACVFGLGYAAVALPAFLLVAAHILAPWSFVLALVVVTAGVWALALRRARPGVQLTALREELAGERVAVVCGLVVLLAIALLRLRFSPLVNFSMYGPWRYWADALEIADAGRVPAATLQWGATYTPTVSKVVLNSYHAGLSYLIGRAPLPAMGALLWIASVGFAAALWALARELGLRLTAPLLPLLLLAVLDGQMRSDLDVYTAENVGRMVAGCGLVLGVRVVRDRGGVREAAAAALLFGLGFATHGVPVFAFGLALGCYALALLLVRAPALATLGRALGVLGAGALVTVAVLLAAGGDIGFQGASTRDRYAAFGDRVDPTHSLVTGTVEPLHRGGSHWYDPPRYQWVTFVRSATGLSPDAWLRYALPVAACALALVGLRAYPPRLRPLGAFALLFGGVLVAVALAFSYRYRTYIPATFGRHRMYDYASLPLVLVGLGVLEAALARIPAVPRGRFRARISPALLAGGPAVAIAVAAAVTAAPARAGWRTNGEEAKALTAWVGRNLPCDARLLPDRLTLGTFAAESSRVSVVEGMGPYLRPAMLRTVLGQVLGAHRFFRDPRGHEAFLRRLGVDDVLVVKGVRVGSMPSVLETGVDPADFRGVPFLRLLHSTSYADVYAVTPAPRGGAWPRPSRLPGFRCGGGA